MTMPASNVSLTYVRDNMFRDSSIPLNLSSTYYRDAALMPSPGGVSLAAFNNRAIGAGRTKILSQSGGINGNRDVMPYHSDLRIDNLPWETINAGYGNVRVENGLPVIDLYARGLRNDIPQATYCNVWFYCERIGEEHTLRAQTISRSSRGQNAVQVRVTAYNNGYLQGLSTNLTPMTYLKVQRDWQDNTLTFTPNNADRRYIMVSFRAWAGGWNGALGYETEVDGGVRNIEVTV
jgi:hypothetical protein